VELKPFTLEDAHEVREDFEDLIDTEFNLGPALIYIVKDILICPFAEDDRSKFISVYAENSDPAEALKGYSGDEYDVILACYEADDETKYMYLPITAFVAEKGIQYNFP
jgi:hypothetical protein